MVRNAKKIISLCLITVLSLSGAVPAFAATPSTNPIRSITLSPASTNIVVEPSVTANREITLINDGDFDYTAALNVSAFSVNGETYTQDFERIPGTTDATAWVKLSQTRVLIPARQNVVIPYTVTAPKATAAGGYYAVIFAQALNDANSAGVSTINRVGNILYMTVQGDIKEKSSILPDTLKGFTFGSKVTLPVRVKNEGGTHFQSDVKYTVNNIFGKSIFSTDATYYVLPQTTRLMTQEWYPKSFFGIYQVSRSATTPQGTLTMPDKWIVVATPGIIPLLIFLALAISGFIILLSRTKKSQKTHKKSKSKSKKSESSE